MKTPKKKAGNGGTGGLPATLESQTEAAQTLSAPAAAPAAEQRVPAPSEPHEIGPFALIEGLQAENADLRRALSEGVSIIADAVALEKENAALRANLTAVSPLIVDGALTIPPSVKAWLNCRLILAERGLRLGPGGLGWASNETKRPEVEELHAFLHLLAGE